MRYQKKVPQIQQIFYVCILCIILYIFWRFPWQSSKTKHGRTGFSYYYIDDWIKNYPACGGNRQSPMDLMKAYVNWTDEHNNTYERLMGTNFDQLPISVQLSNIGHTIKVSFEWGPKIPTISGGILPGQYQLDSIIFHWDSRSDEGSEHEITDKKSPMEMQSIFYKSGYRNYHNALNFYDGLAIISDLFGFEPKKYEKVSPIGLNRIIQKLFDVQYPGSSVDLQPFPFSLLRKSDFDVSRHFMYYGSLTRPPCTENVIWIINAYENYINKQQMEDIQKIVKFWNSETHNHRELQPVNGRFLYQRQDLK
ncbi:carbonic anhydrase 1-like [Chelonus insularis]|uniref:carbonic anhydrase 1-like n=1 Tax=Chelonus insularis TaxID=460826 RepID=UPI00158D407C|nr:carbonic anhydrase 1-like [Chelonus insularis]XP_034950620.1 carbonic anhydrase 1-like [Chelonus insularis]